MTSLTPNEYLKQPYKRFIIHDSEAGMYTVGIEEFEGCLADADTIEGAFEQLEENALAWLEAEIEAGHEIPQPSILADPPQYSGRVSLRLPPDIHRMAAEHAAATGTSLNATLVAAVSYYLGATRAASRTGSVKFAVAPALSWPPTLEGAEPNRFHYLVARTYYTEGAFTTAERRAGPVKVLEAPVTSVSTEPN